MIPETGGSDVTLVLEDAPDVQPASFGREDLQQDLLGLMEEREAALVELLGPLERELEDDLSAEAAQQIADWR